MTAFQISSALEVLTTTALYKFTYLLTYSQRKHLVVTEVGWLVFNVPLNTL